MLAKFWQSANYGRQSRSNPLTWHRSNGVLLRKMLCQNNLGQLVRMYPKLRLICSKDLIVIAQTNICYGRKLELKDIEVSNAMITQW